LHSRCLPAVPTPFCTIAMSMALPKPSSLIILAVSIASASANGICDPWSDPIEGDIDGIGMGGTSADDLQICKERCVSTSGCQTAQFCASGNSCNYNGMNCFIYSNQNFKQPLAQLDSNGPFNSYTYSNKCNGAGSWTGPFNSDIQGTGTVWGNAQFGGTWAYSLGECKQRCVNTINCRAAQFSSGAPYYNDCSPAGHSGCNCYIYNNQNDNKAVTNDIRDFLLYKYDDNGQTDSWGGRRLQDSKDNTVIAV